ncbi:exonuclease 1, partial [Tanacetum coccineum]
VNVSYEDLLCLVLCLKLSYDVSIYKTLTPAQKIVPTATLHDILGKSPYRITLVVSINYLNFYTASKRKGNHDLAMAKLKEGNINAATEMFQRAVSITPSMAHQLIQILKSENIEFVVAPYEADAQLAYLSSLEEDKGGIAAVISEDSDLLAYGCSSVRTQT